MLVVEWFLSVVDKDPVNRPLVVLGASEGVCVFDEVRTVVVIWEVSVDVVASLDPDVFVDESSMVVDSGYELLAVDTCFSGCGWNVVVV